MKDVGKKMDVEKNYEIMNVIRKKIHNNEFEPNQKINQTALAKEMGVSRTLIVKALNKLEVEGLVKNIPNCGFVIHEFCLNDMLELFEIRQCLEIIAVNRAVEKATEADIEAMRELFRPFLSGKEIDKKAYLQADQEFHKKIIAFSENERMNHINSSMMIFNQSYIFGLLRAPEETLKEHMEIIDTIEKRDSMAAKFKVMEHLEFTNKYLNDTCHNLAKLGIDSRNIPFRSVMKDNGPEMEGIFAGELYA